MLISWFWSLYLGFCKMLTLEEAVWGVYRNSLNYCCDFSLSLKLIQIKKFLKKEFFTFKDTYLNIYEWNYMLEIYCEIDQLRRWQEVGRVWMDQECWHVHACSRWALSTWQFTVFIYFRVCVKLSVIYTGGKIPRWFWHIFRAKKHCSESWKCIMRSSVLYYQLQTTLPAL